MVLPSFCLLIICQGYGSSQELLTEVDHTSPVKQAEEQGETHDNSLYAVGGIRCDSYCTLVMLRGHVWPSLFDVADVAQGVTIDYNSQVTQTQLMAVRLYE